jgi:hypothetical protein
MKGNAVPEGDGQRDEERDHYDDGKSPDQWSQENEKQRVPSSNEINDTLQSLETA